MAMAMANQLPQLKSPAIAVYLGHLLHIVQGVFPDKFRVDDVNVTNRFKFLLNGQQVGHDSSSALAEQYMIFMFLD